MTTVPVTTGKERMRTALRGGKPDCVPIAAIYDLGYVLRSTGRDIREWTTATHDERIAAIEESFLLHQPIDGFFVHGGCTDAWADAHTVERFARYWRVTEKKTGARWGLLPDGNRCAADGTPLPLQGGDIDRESRIRTPADISKVLGTQAGVDQIEASGRFDPLRRLARKYPDRHFSTQTTTPMVYALKSCGGYVEGLSTMALDRALFRKILEWHTEETCALFAPARKAGADSTWFTSYYTGADTISPRDYAEWVFPYERILCEEARRQGLAVLNWYLGDLMPNLDTVMELPIDALVLEQGRKGYTIDPVAIRRRVGSGFCLFGYGFEQDFCTFNRAGLTRELRRQIEGAACDGAFVSGAPIMPPNAMPEAVDYYFAEARRLGAYAQNPRASSRGPES